MANSSLKYFELWLRNEIVLARRSAASRQKVIDAKAAAEGWLRSGRRIIKSIRLVADTCLPLADKVYAKASEKAGLVHYRNGSRSGLGSFGHPCKRNSASCEDDLISAL